MSIHRHALTQALRALGNADVFVGAYNSAAVSVPGAAVDPGGNNVGNGTVGSIVGKANAPSEVITLTATNATTFAVVGSLSGVLGNATVGTPFVSAVINFTITAGGAAFVAGDNFTITVVAGAGNWVSLGAKEGAITETKEWGINALTAPEHTGGIPHQATAVLNNYAITIPIIAGEDDLWALIEPIGSKDGVPDGPTDVITTSVFVVPRDILGETGLAYNPIGGWVPAAPDNRTVFIPRAYLTSGDVSRPYENGGKSIVDVTIHPMWYPSGPVNKRLFVRGDPVAAGYTDFRM